MRETMGESDERLDAAIREALAEERAVLPGEHPDPEVLLAYHEGELSEAEAERVREHLVECDACTDVILDFAAFPDLEPPAEEDRLTPAELRHDREALEARIGSGGRSWWSRAEYAALPAAAVFLLAALGLGIWGWQLRGNVVELEATVAELRAPESVELVTISDPDEVTRGGEPIVLQLDAEGLVVLSLPWSGDGFSRYSIDLGAADDELSLRELEVEEQVLGGFAVKLSRDLFEPGENVLELYGHREGERVLLARYPVVATQ